MKCYMDPMVLANIEITLGGKSSNSCCPWSELLIVASVGSGCGCEVIRFGLYFKSPSFSVVIVRARFSRLQEKLAN